MQNYLIGIDIGGTMIKGAVFTTDGGLVRKISVETQIAMGRDQALKNLLSLVASLQENREKLLSIGIGVAGVLDEKREVLLESPNLPELNKCPLKETLTEVVGVPVFLENDASLAALGEKWTGAARKLNNFLFITLGTGIGAGLILNGNLWSGELGKAGEFGHMVVEQDGIQCACGKKGCLEAYSSAEAVKRMAIEAVRAGTCSGLKNLCQGNADTIDAEMVYHAAKNGDSAAIEIFKRVAKYLAIGSANVNNLLDIHNFILGGGMGNAFDIFAPFIREEVDKQVFKISRSRIRIIQSQLGNDAGVFGAGCLALQGIR